MSSIPAEHSASSLDLCNSNSPRQVGAVLRAVAAVGIVGEPLNDRLEEAYRGSVARSMMQTINSADQSPEIEDIYAVRKVDPAATLPPVSEASHIQYEYTKENYAQLNVPPISFHPEDHRLVVDALKIYALIAPTEHDAKEASIIRKKLILAKFSEQLPKPMQWLINTVLDKTTQTHALLCRKNRDETLEGSYRPRSASEWSQVAPISLIEAVEE